MKELTMFRKAWLWLQVFVLLVAWVGIFFGTLGMALPALFSRWAADSLNEFGHCLDKPINRRLAALRG